MAFNSAESSFLQEANSARSGSKVAMMMVLVFMDDGCG